MSQTKTTKPHPFVTYLQSKAEDRGVLATLRQGAGRPPGSIPAMYQYLSSWVQHDNLSAWQEDTHYLVAALFAVHPKPTDKGNLGDHFHQTDPGNDNQATARRLTLLLNTHPEDLHRYLYRAITFLKSKDVAVNWHELFRDVSNWNSPNRRQEVQKEWAKGYWQKEN